MMIAIRLQQRWESSRVGDIDDMESIIVGVNSTANRQHVGTEYHIA